MSEPGTLFDDKAELCSLFQWQFGIAFHMWQYVGGIVIDSLLSTHDKFSPPVQAHIFICHKCGSRTLLCIMEHLHAIVIC